MSGNEQPAADFVTVDLYEHRTVQTPFKRRAAAKALGDLSGLRAATVNYANSGTDQIIPKPVGTCILAAWTSREAAERAWRETLLDAMGGPADFRMDGEVARARFEYEGNDWHGWKPSDQGAEGIKLSEPLVAIVHGIVQPRYLKTFVTDNVHAASRAAHHPGHRGSINLTSKPPFENTSVSLWSSREQAQDFAYVPGGHSHGMTRSRELQTHHTGVFLRVRPLACSGGIGEHGRPFPDLPPTDR